MNPWLERITQNAVDLIKADISLGLTFTEVARIAYGEGHTQHGDEAIGRAWKAVDAVKKILSEHLEIEQSVRVDLESRIAEFLAAIQHVSALKSL